MALPHARPSFPSVDLQVPQPPSPLLASNDDTSLGSGLSQALEQQLDVAHTHHINSAPSTSSGAVTHPSHHDMAIHKEKDIRPRLEIVLDDDTVILRGTGSEVEPARLSGHVALFLSESSSIKEITLHFRGKARIPTVHNDSRTLASSAMTYILCDHEWSFLKGERKHSHTLKAGHHIFPFQLQIGGSLPCSLVDQLTAGGTASVLYKFRAHAVRPGLSHNLHCVVPVTVLRSFVPDALEYQQTLEIENTWPGKLMYSIMVPHKAWAAGESVLSIFKLVPLVKGVHVTKVTTQIQETVKLYKSGSSMWGAEHTKIVARASHKIMDKRAVPIDIKGSPTSRTPGSPGFSLASRPTTGTSPAGHYLPGPGSLLPRAGSSSTHHISGSGPSTASSSSREPEMSQTPHQPYEEEPSEDVVTTMEIPIPICATPSHNLEPALISHRIRWSLLISNSDGHTSELRCSLPLHILDPRVSEEARSHTVMTRRLLLAAVTGEGGDGEHGEDTNEDESRELPSYNSHIRDRIANQYAIARDLVHVGNPWSPHPRILGDHHSTGHNTPGWMSPTHEHVAHESHLPHAPPSGASHTNPLDWVNRRLLATRTQPLNNVVHGDHDSPEDHHHSSPSEGQSRDHSRHHSRGPSRRSSRRNSPERRTTLPMPRSPHSPSHPPWHAPQRPQDGSSIHVHGDAEDDSHVDGLFAPQMRQVSSFASALSRSHASSYTNLSASSSGPSSAPHSYLRHSDSYTYGERHPENGSGSPYHGPAGASSPSSQQHGQDYFTRPNEGEVLQRIQQGLTQVPDYGTAARGFIGGVTPLDLMRGLPSYDDAQRQMRDRPAVSVGPQEA